MYAVVGTCRVRGLSLATITPRKVCRFAYGMGPNWPVRKRLSRDHVWRGISKSLLAVGYNKVVDHRSRRPLDVHWLVVSTLGSCPVSMMFDHIGRRSGVY